MDSGNLWTRRTKYARPTRCITRSHVVADRHSSGKLSLTNSSANTTADQPSQDTSRRYSSTKRFGSEASSSQGGRPNPFNAIAPLTTSAVASPTAGASSAFGLGSGAFASFGASKTPKKLGAALDFGGALSPSLTGDRESSYSDVANVKQRSSSSSLTNASSGPASEHPLKHTWVVWYRPPTSKYSDYEKSTLSLVAFSTVEAFWTAYFHLKRPSSLPAVSDYHVFKKGVRPVWEDKENRRGGKWIVRLKKGVADRYWEDLLLGIVGDQFAEAGDEVCGAVLSVRGGEDVLSVWTRIDGGRNIKIRCVPCLDDPWCSRADAHTTVRRSSACWPFRQTPTSCGAATTTASRSARPSTRRGMTRAVAAPRSARRTPRTTARPRGRAPPEGPSEMCRRRR